MHVHRQFYDRTGNVRVIEELWPGAIVKDRRLEMTYDGAQRLQWEHTKGWNGTNGQWVAGDSVQYVYDNANNRTEKSRFGATQNGQGVPIEKWESTYNNVNQLTDFRRYASGVQSEARTYDYDLNGNRKLEERTSGENLNSITDLERRTFTYDARNRLVTLYETDVVASEEIHRKGNNYTYDYRTRRVERSVQTFGPSGGTGGVVDTTQVTFSGGVSVREDRTETGEVYGTSHPPVFYIRGSDWGGGVGGILYRL